VNTLHITHSHGLVSTPARHLICHLSLHILHLSIRLLLL